MLATLDATGRLNNMHTIPNEPHPHKISIELNRELAKFDGVQTEEIATAKTMDSPATNGEVDVELTVANNESQTQRREPASKRSRC